MWKNKSNQLSKKQGRLAVRSAIFASLVALNSCIPGFSLLPTAETNNPMDPFTMMGALLNQSVAPGSGASGGAACPSSNDAEINVQVDGTNYASGSTYNFGSVVNGQSGSAITFSIQNLGSAELNLTGTPIDKTGTNQGDYAVTQPGQTTVASCGTVTFNITFTAGGIGTRTAQISIASNDADENPYTIQLTGEGTTDTTAPANPGSVSATAGDAQVTIGWTNSSDTDFAGITIVFATGGTAPANCSSGTQLCTGAGCNANVTPGASGLTRVHSSLTNGTQYSYRVCAFDGVPNTSTGTTVSATPTAGPDTTPPANPGSTTFTAGDQQVTIGWTNPADSDFAGVTIVFATGATAPANCSAGTQLCTGTGCNANVTAGASGLTRVHSSLTNGTQYSYRICAFDEVPNNSSGATGSATPSVPNLVSNPSFESDTSAPPASWTIATGTLQASTGTITAQSGSNVANFTALTTALSGREALSNCFAISGAQSVTAAGYFYTPDPVGNTEASIGVRYYSDASCSTAVGTLTSTTSALSTQATWQQLTHTKAANGSATHAKVSIRARRLAAGSELIYFDNITAAQP